MPRLDSFLATQLAITRSDVRLLLARGAVEVDGVPATGIGQPIGPFQQVQCDGEVLQARTARYLMLHKPRGVVSATRDDRHRTVIDLLDPMEAPWKDQLHIAGRLDINSTGLLLLTNDGRWSRRLTAPESKLRKRYRVTVDEPLSQEHVDAFRRGFRFDYEGIDTRPADLVILGEFEAEVGLVEGRYHQIRRMFGRLGNRVTSIHRFAVGPLELDSDLAPGASRELHAEELEALGACAGGAYSGSSA